jgi:hypothetical protein
VGVGVGVGSTTGPKQVVLGLTISVSVPEWVLPPPVPVTVTENVPLVAVANGVTSSCELPDPGAAIEVGLKVAEAPLGTPEADSEMALLNPLRAAVVIVLVPEPPCTAVTLGRYRHTPAGAACR